MQGAEDAVPAEAAARRRSRRCAAPGCRSARGVPALALHKPGAAAGAARRRAAAGRAQPPGVSRQGAARPEALLGGPLPAAPRREAQGCGFKHKHHDKCLSRRLVVEISSCR